MQKSEKSFKRGEIYFCDFGNGEGSVQGGKRPVLILQEEGFNHKAPTIIVAAITTVIKKTYLRSHIYLCDSFGLPKPSMVLLEQIKSVNKSELKEFIGYIDDGRVWAEINSALKKTFGLWLYNPERTGNIRPVTAV